MNVMHIGEGLVKEITLWDGSIAARILCHSNLIPAPGQYLLACTDGLDATLPASVFKREASPQGFLTAPPIPTDWKPGTRLRLRGPLGHGFAIPLSARYVALTAWDDCTSRLMPLMEMARKQGAAVTLVTGDPPEDLPLHVEVQPFSALDDVIKWADLIAVDVKRESLPQFKQKLGFLHQPGGRGGKGNILPKEVQVLVVAPMPCGGVAECGVCAVHVNRHWKMACKDGPVFALRDLI